MAVVWAVEHFKHHLHGQEFKLLTDHQALLSALKENRGKKTYQSRLTRWVDRLLPFNFKIEHLPGKDMGFADYLSRNPSQPPPPSTDDTQFIIYTINNFKYFLLNDTTKKLSADNYQTHNDVISNKAHAAQKTNAFCQSRYNNQSPAFATNLSHSNSSNSIHSYPTNNPIYKSSIKSFKKSSNSNHSINQNPSSSNYNPHDNTLHSIYNPPVSKSSIQHSAPFTTVNVIIPKYQKVLVTTRRNPTTETNLHPIIKRKRTPNKYKMQNISKTFTSSSTQTEGTSNKGKGRTPLRSDPDISIYPLGIQAMPEYRKNLSQVFGEEFRAEATQKDKQLAPLIKLIRDRDWNTMKTVNPYFYSLERDLSVTP